MNEITIVMYHYVREIKKSMYPDIKGLELDGFKRQLEFLTSKYNLITAEQAIDCSLGKVSLPKNACWLTFDDGYKDHIQYVLPELLSRGLQGSFFPPVKPITERKMLDVNIIHFVLAASPDKLLLMTDLNNYCLEFGVTATELNSYWDEHAISDRFDTKEVIYIKRMLQHILPENLRAAISGKLFEKYVRRSPSDFADDLYLSIDDTKVLVNSGMYVGSHGYRHVWLNKEPHSSQELEITSSLSFLKAIGAPTKDWVMCYPYGVYNQQTLDILKTNHCAIGLTTEVATANLDTHNLLELPRYDTNDFAQ